MTDAQGAPVLNIMNKLLSLHKTWIIADGQSSDGKEHARVQSHFALGGAKMTVAFTNTADQTPLSLELRGNWLDMYADCPVQ